MKNQNYTTLIIERDIDAPVSLVWKALTDYSLLKQWLPFFPDFKAVKGFTTQFTLGKDEEHQYKHEVEVLEVVPIKKLTYTWRYPDYTGNSNVTFSLSGNDAKTKVVLTHIITEDFLQDNLDFAKNNFLEGWTYTIDGLKKFVEKEVKE